MEEQDLSRRQEKTIYTDGDTISTLLVLIFHYFFWGEVLKGNEDPRRHKFFFLRQVFVSAEMFSFFCNTRTWVRAKTYIYIWGGLTSCVRDFVNTPAIRMIQLKQFCYCKCVHQRLFKDYLSNLSFSHVCKIFLMKVCLADFCFC